jgi:hypothetical protein
VRARHRHHEPHLSTLVALLGLSLTAYTVVLVTVLIGVAS